MKKFLLTILCVILALSMGGCFQQGPQYENLDTNVAPDPDSIKQTDYANDLDGLVGYLKALGYLPTKTDPTVMLAEVIGAKKGYRYIFNVDNSTVIAELYEYDTSYSDPNAARVIGEIKETGSFHLFGQENVDGDTVYAATLSDNGKYMMIYNDGSSNQNNVVRRELIKNAVKGYYSDSANTSETSGGTETSKPAETSQTSDSSVASKPAETSQTSEASKASDTSKASAA